MTTRTGWLVITRLLASEVFKTFCAVLAVIVVIIVSRNFVKILAKAIDGQIASDTVFVILLLKTLQTAINLMPVALFMAVIMVLGRMYREQEMTALRSAGAGLGTLWHGVAWTTLPLTVLATWLSLMASPWAEQRIQQVLRGDKKTADLRAIEAGRFSEYSQGDVVFYTEHIRENDVMEHIFMQNRGAQRLGITSAATATLQYLPDGRYLILQNGERVTGWPGEAAFMHERFNEYALRVDDRPDDLFTPRNAMDSAALWTSRDLADIAELQRRLSIPLGVLLLGALGMLLAQTAPRQGVYGNLLIAFLIYLVYGNLQKFSQSGIVKGVISPIFGHIGVYLLMAVVLAALTIRFYGWRWLWKQLAHRSAS